MSQHFSFRTVSDITVGVGASSQLGDAACELGIDRILVVTDPVITKCGLLDQATASLKAKNVAITLFDQVVADPPEEVVHQALKIAQEQRCNGVVGFGGGSSMDVAKLLSVLIAGDQKLEQIYGVNQVKADRVPLIQVPTTAGTGSEVTMVSIITAGKNTKSGVVSANLLADKVILDAELTLGLPPAVTAATGIDAMVHAIEAYTSKHLKNPLSDMLACQALKLLAGNITTAVQQGDNIEARSAMLLGAMLAGQAFANSPVAGVHALAYPLGGNYHIPHGLSNSLVLPHMLRFNASACADMYAQLAPIILSDRQLPSCALKVSDLLADYFLSLAGKLGLQTTLKEMNIPQTDLPMLAQQALLQQRLLINNPRTVSEEDALYIYRQAY